MLGNNFKFLNLRRTKLSMYGGYEFLSTTMDQFLMQMVDIAALLLASENGITCTIAFYYYLICKSKSIGL